MKGKRLGLADRNAGPCWQAIKTIRYMSPVMYVMENVIEICSATDADADALTLLKKSSKSS